MIVFSNTKAEVTNNINNIEAALESIAEIPASVLAIMKKLPAGIPFIEQSPITISHDVEMEKYPVDGYSIVTDYITVKPTTITGTLIFAEDQFNESFVSYDEETIPFKNYKWGEDGFGPIPKKAVDSFGALVATGIGAATGALMGALGFDQPPPFPPEETTMTTRWSRMGLSFIEVMNALEYMQRFGWLFTIIQASDFGGIVYSDLRIFYTVRLVSFSVESVAGVDTHQIRVSMETVDVVAGVTFDSTGDNALNKLRYGKKAPPRGPEGNKSGKPKNESNLNAIVNEANK
jgi:hypothetical protein